MLSINQTDEKVRLLALGVYKDAVMLREKFHQHPELGFEEYKTSQVIEEYLRNLGLDVEAGIAQTGVIGTLQGGKEGPIVAFRADMDALPIQERTNVPFASQIPNVMHACGHDMHMAMLLAAAKALSEHREEIYGTIKFIFQPAEEMKGGGKRIVEAGALETPDVDYAFGFHVWPELPMGTYGFRDGTLMASMDTFEVTLKGKQGHGAAPHQGVDALIGAAHVVTALQSIVSREVNPLDSVVITIGKIEAGAGYNIIPDQAVFKGTVRTINSQTRLEVEKSIERIVKGISASLRMKADVRYERSYPITKNTPHINKYISLLAQGLYGEKSVHWLEHPSMASEDFAFYLEKVPGAFVFLGVKDEELGAEKLHSEYFLPKHEAMIEGISLFISLGLNPLSLEMLNNREEREYGKEE
ncbi:M20 metallopeptidase family protein [Priestia filamentosa]|uniref:M20 metallopeptidase family protein n=1 Tax=Priestia filamentosa TaxID=1402861 RepID=UPI000AAE1772|nr:M20 family metallopeptidase [Priestia filamentosa]